MRTTTFSFGDRSNAIAAFAAILVGIAGLLWLFLESTPVRLGFDDTDNPTVMVSFIRQHPEVFAQAGVVLVMAAIALAIAVLALAEILAPATPGLTLRVSTAFGLFAAAILLLGGGVRVGSSGPLLHMAGVSQQAGEAAYVAAQVVSQAVLISGVLCLSMWVVGLSLIGLRKNVLPLALCALAILPAYRLVGSILGPLGLLPDWGVLWLLGIASIFGTFGWCVLLGMVLISRVVRRARS